MQPQTIFYQDPMVWADAGDFRDTNHHSMGMEHGQLGFPAVRSRNRDRKARGFPGSALYRVVVGLVASRAAATTSSISGNRGLSLSPPSN
ncbi:unnamed protein product [Bemisia tabaci]|uniref:Uncharacterized protein n=1 Tax=Bemisia tabaci TaxID=7038 RepID=A0A9P0CAX5_BEMTA|nr:unnamed protein product [Bemisia tabaci]